MAIPATMLIWIRRPPMASSQVMNLRRLLRPIQALRLHLRAREVRCEEISTDLHRPHDGRWFRGAGASCPACAIGRSRPVRIVPLSGLSGSAVESEAARTDWEHV